MEFLSQYGLFLAKSVTLVIAILIVVAGVVAISSRGRSEDDGEIEVHPLNERFDNMEKALKKAVLDEHDFKSEQKEHKKREKEEKKHHKESSDERKKRVYVVSFDGDMKASAVDNLREEVTAILTLADRQDEVVLCLESPGGMVHTYGLAASQLARVTQREIPLTIVVDAVAASGGYMMACIGNKILAAPFAIIGSIGVVAQVPNFHRLLKKHNIDYELFTAGEHKRTVTIFGENTEKGKKKFLEDIQDTHELFKSFVSEHRPQVNINEVATGEIWYGRRALEQNLVDDLQTSDEYLMSLRNDCDIYSIKFTVKKSLQEKLGLAAQHIVDGIVTRLMSRFGGERRF